MPGRLDTRGINIRHRQLFSLRFSFFRLSLMAHNFCGNGICSKFQKLYAKLSPSSNLNSVQLRQPYHHITHPPPPWKECIQKGFVIFVDPNMLSNSWTLRDILTTYSWLLLSLFVIYSGRVHDLFMISSRPVQDFFMTLLVTFSWPETFPAGECLSRHKSCLGRVKCPVVKCLKWISYW